MYAAENPGLGMVFKRPGHEPEIPQSELTAAWERVLVGKAHDGMMAKWMPSEAVRKRLREVNTYSRPVVRRGPAAPPATASDQPANVSQPIKPTG